MQNIVLRNVEKGYAGKEVLRDVTLTLSENQRVALVGENGAGKSTLIKLVSGEFTADGGRVEGSKAPCVRIGQDFTGEDEETPFEFLDRRVQDVNRSFRFLNDAGFNTDDGSLFALPCGQLSGGEKKKLEIVAGLASGASFLALDEPENHLDYAAIEWLIDELATFRGGILFVSHDQYFIDRLANTIVELEEGKVSSYSMSYGDYLAMKRRQIAGQEREWVMSEKTIKRMQSTVEKLKRQAQKTARRSKTYQQAKRRYQEMKEAHGARPTSQPSKPMVTLDGVEKKNKKLIVRLRDLWFSYGEREIFTGAENEIRFGEKVVLFGPNGSGKTTLIKLLASELEPVHGEAYIGTNVNWQYLTQDHLAGLDATSSPLQVFDAVLEWPETRMRSILAKYGITKEVVHSPLRELSGGQQARFKLALTFAQKPEFLILDEPTNHVDPPTWDAITEAVKEYSGTVLAVTHDRALIDEIAEKLWVIEDGQIQTERGTLSDYLGVPEDA